eukprot:c11478_g1_i4.p1 GENE.c11478_g1_i4~~c11478_g1_i4.p1  ORF type:complete len:104 (-),score=12.29 c11478_g1_i4:36-347(-)
MTNLFQDQSTVVWNGIPYRGKIAIAQMLQALPPSKHTVISFDCQPVVIDGVITLSFPVVVSVLGEVEYGSDPAMKFSHCFTLTPLGSGANYCIASDCFRLLGD